MGRQERNRNIIALFAIACGTHLDAIKWEPKSSESKNYSKPSTRAEHLSPPRWISNSTPALQDENCRRVYEWSLMNHWESQNTVMT